MKAKFFIFIICISWLSISIAQIQTIENRFTDCAPGSFRFYTASPLASYNWDFGGLGTSTSDTQLFIFPNPGSYLIQVGSFSQIVNIVNKPKVTIQNLSPRQGCLPFTVSLRNTTTLPAGINFVSYEWFLFPEGVAKYTDTITHTFNTLEPSCDVQLRIFTNSAACNADSNYRQYLHMVDTPKVNFSLIPPWQCDDSTSFIIQDLTTVSVFDTPTYLWTWNLPTLTTSTTKNLGAIPYKHVEGYDTITLQVSTKYGCPKEKKFPVQIDTTSVGFIVDTDTTCTSGEINLTIKSDTALFGYIAPNTSPTFFQSIMWTDFVYTIKMFDVPTGTYPLSVSKFRLDYPNCIQDSFVNIYVINDKPIIRVNAQISCNSYIIDTVFISGWTQNVIYAEVVINYYDLYNIIKKKKYTVTALKPYVIDTFYYHRRVDSFYRNGNYLINATAEFHFHGTSCTLLEGIGYPDTVNFYSWLKSDKTVGCNSLPVKFTVYPNANHEIDSVFWHFDDGLKNTTTADSPYHKDTIWHTYTTPGKYRAHAIVLDKNGCRDTTNPIWIRAGDNAPPAMYVDKDTICYNEDLRISKIGAAHYDHLFFVTDSFREMNCPRDTTVLWRGFHHAGMQQIRLYGVKDGCEVFGVDSVFVRGPKFAMDYIFDCQTPDSVLFTIRDTFGIGTSSYKWTFGDTSSPLITTQDSVWHKFPSGDFIVKVESVDVSPILCPYVDTTIVHIRKVNAYFLDTIFCKFSTARLDPLLSTDADYGCEYKYSWVMNWKTNFYDTISGDSAVKVYLPYDTVKLTLIARDFNGCENAYTRNVYSVGGDPQFKITNKDYKLNQYLCRPEDVIRVKSSSTTPFGLTANYWTVNVLKNNTLYPIYEDTLPALKTDTFFTVNAIRDSSDTFVISYRIGDSAQCGSDPIYNMAIFYNDHAQFICPDTVCENTKNQIRLTTYDPINVKYEWYKNGVKLPKDTTNILNDSLSIIGSMPTSYIFKLIRRNVTSGCVDSFIDTTVVNFRPRLYFHNTFDSTAFKCAPGAKTKFWYYDTANTDLHFYWRINGVSTGNMPSNPFNLSLNPGITVVEGSFWTTYGCKDTWTSMDTVIALSILVTPDKTEICNGDTVRFILSNMRDVDTLKMTLGDGNFVLKQNLTSITADTFKHYYAPVSLQTDTVRLQYIISSKNNICQPISDSFKLVVKNVKTSFEVNNKDSIVCFGRVPILNTSTIADSFVWDFGIGSKIIDRYKSLTYFDYSMPGTYKIVLYGYRVPEKCVDTSIHFVTLYASPSLSVQKDKDTICLGDTLVINYSDTMKNTLLRIIPDSFKGNPYSTSPIKTKIIRDTLVTLISESVYNCYDTVKIAVTVIQPQKINSFDTIVASGSIVRLPFSYDSTWRYAWTPAHKDPSCVNCSHPEMQFITPTRYQLSYRDYRNCFLRTAEFYIDIYKDIRVGIPSAFTPNGDGINDMVCVKGFGMKKLISFKIYNRLGALIFATNDGTLCWDGYYKNVLQNQDVYYYTYEAESFVSNKLLKGEGNFMLLR